MKKKLTPALISLGLLTLVGCGNEENTSSANDEVDAEIGDVLVESDAGDISVDQVLDEIGMSTIGNMTFQMTLDMLLEDKYASEVDTEAVNEQVDQAIENMGGEEAFAQLLAQQMDGMSVEEYRETMIMNEYSNVFFGEKFEIDDEMVQEEVATGAHILITFEEPAEEEESVESEEDADSSEEDAEGEEETEAALTQEEALEKAESLIEELNDGADFAELAEEHSEDPGSGANGGDLGLVTKGQMVAPFEEALFGMDEDSISEEPVLSDFGYHIIQRNEQPDAAELGQVRAQIINREAQSRPDEVYQAYVDLLDEYNVEFVNDDLREYIEESFLNREEAEEAAEEVEEATEEDEAAKEDADADAESESDEDADDEDADADDDEATEDEETDTEDEE